MMSVCQSPNYKESSFTCFSHLVYINVCQSRDYKKSDFYLFLVILCLLVSASKACLPAQVGCSCGSAHDAEGRTLHTDTVWCDGFPETNNVKY